MFNWLKERRKRELLKKFVKQNHFYLNGSYGFSVNGVLVSEFGYLLRYVSDGKHETFNNFEALADDFVSINGAIVLEMRKPVPREMEVNFTTRDGALTNLENLQTIVRSITKYVELARKHGFDPNPLR